MRWAHTLVVGSQVKTVCSFLTEDRFSIHLKLKIVIRFASARGKFCHITRGISRTIRRHCKCTLHTTARSHEVAYQKNGVCSAVPYVRV